MKWQAPKTNNLDSRVGGKSAFVDEAKKLRARPGVWAVVRAIPVEDDKRASLQSIAHRVPKGLYKALRPAGAFEATVQIDREEGVHKLFMRFTGKTGLWQPWPSRYGWRSAPWDSSWGASAAIPLPGFCWGSCSGLSAAWYCGYCRAPARSRQRENNGETGYG